MKVGLEGGGGSKEGCIVLCPFIYLAISPSIQFDFLFIKGDMYKDVCFVWKLS